MKNRTGKEKKTAKMRYRDREQIIAGELIKGEKERWKDIYIFFFYTE